MKKAKLRPAQSEAKYQQHFERIYCRGLLIDTAGATMRARA
jgi:hypothetical protein